MKYNLLRRKRDGTWHSCGLYDSHDAAYSAIRYWADGGLTWDDFKLKRIRDEALYHDDRSTRRMEVWIP